MDDNQALREILGEVRLLDSILREQYDAVVGINREVTSEIPMIRPAADNIVKTVVTNLGTAIDVTITEEGVPVKVLPPLESWTSPLAGNGEIVATVPAGYSSLVAIATYTKG